MNIFRKGSGKNFVDYEVEAFYFVVLYSHVGCHDLFSEQKLDVKFENELIVSVLDYLKMQTGYQFFFQKGVVPETEKITVNLKNATLIEVIVTC